MAQVTAKRAANIRGQKHMLSYITPAEARLLRAKGGAGKPGPKGIPSYYSDDDDMFEGQAMADFESSYNDPGDTGGDFRSETNVFTRDPGEKIEAKAPQKSDREKALDEVNARIDRLSTYSEKEDTNIINRYAARANVMGASRVANKLKEEGSIAVRNKTGKVVGVMHKGRFGMIYSGQLLEKKDYTGPKEFERAVTFASDGNESGGDDRSEAARRVTPIEGGAGVGPPKISEDGTSPSASKKYGPQDTIATTPQGLLNEARTRRRSLFSGGLIT